MKRLACVLASAASFLSIASAEAAPASNVDTFVTSNSPAFQQQQKSQVHPNAASIFCYPVSVTGPNAGKYPFDGHAYQCGASNTTGVIPGRVGIWGEALLTNSVYQFDTQKLKPAGVDYFYFNNRSEANNFFANTAPFNVSALYQTSTARCGNTQYAPAAGIIATSLYDVCYLDAHQQALNLSNPALDRTAYHESGHAFAAALVKGTSNVEPDNTVGFKNLLQLDIYGQGSPTPNVTVGLLPSNWTSYTQAQKNTYICGMFGTSVPSALEYDLGSTTGAVCSGTTPIGNYQTTTPIVIAQDKAPYFIKNTDAWAEEYAVLLGGKTSPATFLPVTDYFLGYTNPPTVGSVTPAPAMSCTSLVVKEYASIFQPPTPGQLVMQRCPTNQGALQ